MRIVFTIILLSIVSLLKAQSLYNNSIISIGASSVLGVKDSLVNNGTIINNGDMQVGGSWINNSQYEAGQGQITFNSDLPQVISHNDQSFSRLTISGGGEKLFRANITIDNALELTDGILISGNNSRIIFSANAEITGGSDNSHVVGPVYHRGPGHKIFPVGNGLLYLPVELLNIEGLSAETGVRAVELESIVLPLGPSLDAVSANRYWEVDLISGSLDNSLVVLPVRDETIVSNGSKVVVTQAESLTGTFESLGQSGFDGDFVTSKKNVSGKLLAVGTDTDDGALIVYNAVSANNDDKNDFLIIGNIEDYEENKFSLFNRWGDKIFEIENYDNKERVFRGKSNISGEKDLVNGTYFYVIETKKNNLKVNGFLALKN